MSERDPKDQLKFAVFMSGDSNYHLAGWRLPDSYADSGMKLSRWVEFAKTMERGKLDMLFIADSIGMHGADDLDSTRHNPQTVELGNVVRHFFGQTVAEVFILGTAGQVHERQDDQ